MRPFLNQDGYDLSTYFSGCKVAAYDPGQLICDLDIARDTIFLVRRGVVRASILSVKGTERLMFYGHAGCTLGEPLSFGRPTEVSRGIQNVAVTHCEVAKMSQTAFRAKCRQEPDLMVALLCQVHDKLSLLVEQLNYAAFHDTIGQVAALVFALWLETKRTRLADDDAPLLNVTHQMIAAATGRTRVSVTGALNRLQALGAIGLHRGRIEVLDEQLLARFTVEPDDAAANVLAIDYDPAEPFSLRH